ncbi:type VI secretion system baseplate subunit TssE [Viridibacterium curvum]|uniref:Type VI secretion system baseplate subunit TssE n=1 Tax=Viridibacterium curvum TaxID=1101404 RepID=A0ABP9QUE8_9RHOO
MADLQPLDRLQPALLDRLTDNDPTNQQPEPKERRMLSRSEFRAAVLRDLSFLLNAARPTDAEGLGAWPEAQKSVLNFGMPSFAGETASTLDIVDLERAVREALILFEPRINASSLRVQGVQEGSVLDWHNQISMRIEATVWAQPVPLDLLLRTDVDLETGQIDVKELGAS